MNSHTALSPIGAVRPAGMAEALAKASETVGRRRKTWDLEGNLHCSIIGTCLTTTDVRHLLRKLKDPEADRADEHALHVKAVRLASNREVGGKLLNKALDRKHEILIKRFSRARSAEDLRKLWDEADRDGDISGAYWAIVTHPEADKPLIHDAFGTVHMLSHLVGRSSRADIKRIRALEAQVEDRDARLAELEDRIRRLTDQNVRLAEDAREASSQLSLFKAAQTAELRQVPAAPAAGQQDAAEARVLRLDLARQARQIETLTGHQKVLEAELAAIDAALGDDVPGTSPVIADLAGMTILYVGGRPQTVGRMASVVEAAGGVFLSHDGGIEDARSLLPGYVSRVDATLFPVDCVSHWAMEQAKRHSTALGKPYVALRTASLACFVSALPTICEGRMAQ